MTGRDGTKSRSRNIFRMFVVCTWNPEYKVTDIGTYLGVVGNWALELRTWRRVGYRAGSKQATRRSAAPSPFFLSFFFWLNLA